MTHQRLERDFERIRDEFTPLLGAERVEQCLQDTLDRVAAHARVNSFVPILTQRFARQQLRTLADANRMTSQH